MSSSGSPPPAPERPAWLGGGRSPTKAAPPKPTRSAPNRIQIEVAPDETAIRDFTLRESLGETLREGRSGLAISFGIHALVLGLLAILAYTYQANPPDMWLDAGWRDESRARSATARGPVDLAAVRVPVDDPNERMILNLPPAAKAGNKGNDEELPSSGADPVEVKDLLANRNLELRNQILQKHGGDEQTEAAIRTALLWLKRQQRAGGNWLLHEGYPDAGETTLRTDTGATALALLAFLGTGQTHQTGDHREAVAKGLDWLIRTQKPDGNFHDRYEEGHQSTFYAHAQAVIAICEAYALTGDDALREPAQRGVDFLVKSQNPLDGGWKYRPADDRTVGDLSVTGWALMALHTARAAGLEVDPEAYSVAARFIDSVQVQQGARFKYMPSDPDDRASLAMTAEGLLCRQYLGEPRDRLGMQSGVQFLLDEVNRPEWRPFRRNVYEWYYTAQVLHNLGGEDWKSWYQHVQQLIVRGQSKGGSAQPGKDIRGSWSPVDPHGSDHEYATQAGRLYLTVMCVLILETPYRHAPVYPAAE
jgi:hypothetical protein